MRTTTILILFCLGFLLPAGSQTINLHPVKIEKALYHDVTPPLRDMPVIPPIPRKAKPDKNIIPNLSTSIPIRHQVFPSADQTEPDPVLQDWQGTNSPLSTLVNIEGMGNLQHVAPADPVGDVGPNHYIQAINVSFAIYSKTGILLYGPVDLNTLFQGVGLNNVDGDPIVLYDQLADRWMISAFSAYYPYYEFIAVSQTPDPLGSWNRYAFQFSSIADYPKLGVWPDGYYMSVNMFSSGFNFMGASAVVFERDSILAGKAARMIAFQLDTSYLRLLPADLDGQLLPTGSPGIFATFADDAWAGGVDRLEIFKLQTNWTNPANSTLSGPEIVPVAPFDAKFYNWYDEFIPQKGTNNKVDALSQLFMHRLQYRKFNNYSSLVVNHTVDVDNTNHAGFRWYELRNSGTNWSVYQQGTYAPDSDHRWNGSIAMDGQGNIAIGYSVSGTDLYPSIRATGRKAGDPLNTLPFLEEKIMDGLGSETITSRWGDYSTMTVDPVDDQTFWYTNQYYLSGGGYYNWTTRIAAFTINNLSVGTSDKIPVSGELSDLNIYPNPCWQISNISWNQISKNHAKIEILDVFGNIKKTVVSDEETTGKHQISLKTEGLSAGIYVCRIRVGATEISKKIILLQ